MKLQTGYVAALCTGALCVGVFAPMASATVLFSFASDDNSDGPTFYGNQAGPTIPVNSLVDGEDFDASNDVVVGLMVDVNGDLPGGASTFMSSFQFTGLTTGYNVTAFGGGFIHYWTMGGTFDFTETGSGLEVLQIDFSNALFTSFSNDQFALGSTASLQANAQTDAALTFIPGTPLLGLGIDATDLALQEGFAFTLTNMLAVEDESLPLHLSTGGGWFHDWTAEGSFSARAEAIPAPGALALLGCAALIGRRRRRA